MQHRAEAAEEFGVDKISLLFPSKIFVVEIIIAVQNMEKLCKILRTLEAVHMNERFRRRHGLVVLDGRTHHDGQNIILERLQPELLCDVVRTVGILKRQIELVLSQYIAAFRVVPGAVFSSTVSVDIDCNMLSELSGVFQSVVSGITVTEGDLCYFNGLWGCMLVLLV